MLRWAVLAITHVFSQAKPPVAPSQAQTMCDESIPSSGKVRKEKVKKNNNKKVFQFVPHIHQKIKYILQTLFFSSVFSAFPQPKI